MKLLNRTNILIALLGMLGACGTSTPRPTSRLLTKSMSESRSRPLDPRLAELGSVDCASTQSWNEFSDRLALSAEAGQLCIDSERMTLGRPALEPGVMTLVAVSGAVQQLSSVRAEPSLFGYCRIGSRIRAVWKQRESACIPAKVSEAVRGVLVYHEGAPIEASQAPALYLAVHR